MKSIKELLVNIKQLLLKQSCALCKQSSNCLVCDYCFKDLEKQLSFNKDQIILDDEYDYYHLFNYSKEIQLLLKKLKFNKDVLVISIFETLIYRWWEDFAKEYLNEVDEIIVVPIHRFRYLYRGFNQSELLANKLADCINIEPNFKACKRKKYTKAQAKSSKKDREMQIRNVFELTQSIKSKHLVVFDDVFTTGSTLKELIKTVKLSRDIKKISIVTLVKAGL
ncbi:ComF family protein [Francisella frigiditurris]|uniref:Phosphoribosyl transferase domain protein n=1 Tax=Francisella frigiditurris TaxID=1542390 RepID=A0A1J0KVE1_9GAMM|nr:phosphoribosyltransferase family protein [Francisella frigiditurris]APC97642.1 phosphoribosyl transferase domain protein [Francisella frigiditurris]